MPIGTITLQTCGNHGCENKFGIGRMCSAYDTDSGDIGRYGCGARFCSEKCEEEHRHVSGWWVDVTIEVKEN